MKRIVFSLIIFPFSLICSWHEIFHKGVSHFCNAQYDEAITKFKQVIAQQPHCVQAYFNCGLALLPSNQIEKALSYFQQAIDLDSSYTKAHFNVARAARQLGNTDHAIIAYQNTIALDSSHLNAHFELATLYAEQHKYEQAEQLYKQVLTLDPNCIDGLRNLAHLLRYQGKMSEAISYYKKALIKQPNESHLHYGLSECYLMQGNYQDGFKEFEWRWKRGVDTRNFTNKLWQGESLHGKTIIVRAEYGQGDTIQFIRFAKQLKEMGAYIIVETQHTLMNLLSFCPYVDEIIPVQEENPQLPAHDYQIPIMSLPDHLGITLENIPTDPWLHADPRLVYYWREKLKDDHNFKIGICWEGSPYYEQFKPIFSRKAMKLEHFIPLAQLPQVSLYSLQKMNGLEQLHNTAISITTYNDFDHTHGRFMDTTALIMNLDLVITVDTSVAHIAGALGKPVWVLLPFVADWRWLQEQNDSPWYPSMKLFRQPVPGDWQSVIQQIVLCLPSLLTYSP